MAERDEVQVRKWDAIRAPVGGRLRELRGNRSQALLAGDLEDLGYRLSQSSICRYEQGQVIRVPVAHGDGNYFADEETLNRLEGEGRVAFRYCGPDGTAFGGAANDDPNGSIRGIAGIYNETKTVLGMMPHPENATEAALGSIGGKPLFDGIAAALA